MNPFACFRAEAIMARYDAARDGTRVLESSKPCTCTDEPRMGTPNSFLEMTENNRFAPLETHRRVELRYPRSIGSFATRADNHLIGKYRMNAS
jgi:hypothetical protein